MDFGTDKCAYLKIVKGTIVSDAEPLVMNDLIINSVKEGDTYKYLAIDENISYHGPINKERVSREYFTRTRKIWSSELSAYNKVVSHNAFAVPVLIPAIGVLDWTIGEIKDIDIKTQKILTLTRNFHPNSDVDRLYMQKSLGGCGLRQVQSSYESRIIAIRQHLIHNLHRNSALEYIYEKETNDILKEGQELLQKYNIVSIPNEPPKSISKKFTKADQTSKREHFVQKPLHGYFYKLMDNDNNIDKQQSLAWTKDRFITSDLEGYMGTITEQELPTKYIRNKRDRESGKTPTCNNKCRLCHTAIEDVTQVICNCPEMSARYYLPLRHDRMGKILYTSHIQKHFPETKAEQLQEPECICRIKHMKYWWNIPIKTATKIPHNKPDLVIWNHEKFVCTIVDFSFPLDLNITKKVAEKKNNCGLRIRNMQIMYPNYKFEMIPVVIGCLGYVQNDLKMYVKQLGFDDKEIPFLVRRLQFASISGTVNICKAFFNFNDAK